MTKPKERLPYHGRARRHSFHVLLKDLTFLVQRCELFSFGHDLYWAFVAFDIVGAVFSALGAVAGLYGSCKEGEKDEDEVSFDKLCLRHLHLGHYIFCLSSSRLPLSEWLVRPSIHPNKDKPLKIGWHFFSLTILSPHPTPFEPKLHTPIKMYVPHLFCILRQFLPVYFCS